MVRQGVYQKITLFECEVCFIFISVFILDCSNKSIYGNIQSQNQKKCAKLTLSQYNEYIESSSKPYKDYKRERDSV